MFQWFKNLFEEKKSIRSHQDNISLIDASLQKLGTTKEEVYNYLLEHNHKGERLRPRDCPISMFLKSDGIDVGSGVVGSCGYVKVGGETFPDHSAVGKFVLRFDAGDYPALEEYHK